LCGKDFVAKNPGWSPIWKLAMLAGACTQNAYAIKCIDTGPHQDTIILIFVMYFKFLTQLFRQSIFFRDGSLGHHNENYEKKPLIIMEENKIESQSTRHRVV